MGIVYEAQDLDGTPGGAEIPAAQFRAIRMLWTVFCSRPHRFSFESSQNLHHLRGRKGKTDDELDNLHCDEL